MIQKWEASYVEYLHASHQTLLDKITAEQKLDDDLNKKLQEAIEVFNNLHPEFMIEKEVK